MATTALVTGGSRGIGRAICLRLAREGMNIILHYNSNRAAAEEVATAISTDVTLVRANMNSPQEIERMFADIAHLKLDFLINNAGVWKASPLGSSRHSTVDEIIDTNLKGPFYCTQYALPLMNDGGRIINLSSVAGRIASASGRSLYGAAKAGVEALTRHWAMELAPRKIMVNAIAPGYVTTDMTAEHFSNPTNLELAVKRQPLGSIGTPEDIADVVAFLCSKDARFINGQTINVSGGSVI